MRKFVRLDNDTIDHLDVFWKRTLNDNILYYVVGFIVKSILQKLKCTSCAEMLIFKTNENSYCHYQ